MDQERLFRLAVDAINVHATHEGGRGWRVGVRARRGDEEWADVTGREYTYLSTDELLDVIHAELERVFER